MKKSHSIAIVAVLCLLLIAFGIEALNSRIGGDAPIVVYASFLIDHGYKPYVDVYDMNLPGTYLINIIGGRLFGYGDTAMRRFDLLVLVVLMVCTYSLMKRFGRYVALVGTLAFAVIHLGSGLYLQREFLMLVPITLGVLLSPVLARPPNGLKTLLSGLCFGVAATIKPHALLAAVVIVLFQLVICASNRRECSVREVARGFTVFSLGVLAPIGMMLAYLWQVGAMDGFIDMARGYWPLYGSYDGRANAMFTWARAEHLLKGVRDLGRNGIWLLPAGAAFYYTLFHSDLSTYLKRCVLVLGALAFVFCLYPVITGQFWQYHWLPFRYFIALISSLCLLAIHASRSRYEGLFFAALLLPAFFVSMQPPRTMYSRLTGTSTALKNPEVDEVASYLRTHLEPGDRVQPLDWSGGAVHAMLIAGAEAATPFIYDFYFYHHVSSPHIQKMRRRFVDSLAASNPRFIIEVYSEKKPWPRGADTTREFPELRHFMDTGYSIAMELDNFRVYESLDAASARRASE